jgi:UDP-GlcNAc:undecaprenyl-phosphate/decaprenyl-phosphate GlcNAc-1-phosphate transferase
MLILIFFSIIATALLIKFRLPIAKKLKIIDYPTEKRKIHKLPTPLMGGLIIITNLLLINTYLFSKNELSSLDITIFIFCFFSFIIGLIDDKKKISSLNKLMIIGLAYMIIGVIDKNLFLTHLYSETLDKFFYLGVFHIFFSTLCVLLLINAFNLVDGLNGLAISIAILWLFFIFNFFENVNYAYFILILSLLIMLRFNLKGKFFLGDSGSILIGSLIGIFFITSYNLELSLNTNKISLEKIFILFMIPGLDMFRLFLERIFNKKNPFLPDDKHLHHYLIKNFNLKKTLVIYLLLIIIPIIVDYLNLIYPLLNISITIFIYLLLLNYCKKTIYDKNLKN